VRLLPQAGRFDTMREMRCSNRSRRGAYPETASGRAIGSRLVVWRPIIIAIVLVAFALACGAPEGASPGDVSAAGDSKDEESAVTVEVVTLRAEPLSIEVALSGQLAAEFAVEVNAEISGVIRSIEFAEGQAVAEGDVLFVLRDEEQRARLNEAEAEERLARDIHERTQRLTSEAISSIARRAEAQAALDEARSKVELARLQLSRTRIRAPFDGRVGSLQVGPGERVEPEIGLVAIAAVEKLQLLFTVPEPSVSLARIGGEIHARVVAFPGERFAGRVFFISPTIDIATRRLLIKAWIPNEDHRLKPGMFANVDVVVAARDAALMLPEAAMVYDRHGTYVWRVNGEDRAEKIPVEIGVRQTGRVEVVAGLSAGDRVVSAGINKVMAASLIDAVLPAVDGAAHDVSGKAPERTGAGG